MEITHVFRRAHNIVSFIEAFFIFWSACRLYVCYLHGIFVTLMKCVHPPKRVRFPQTCPCDVNELQTCLVAKGRQNLFCLWTPYCVHFLKRPNMSSPYETVRSPFSKAQKPHLQEAYRTIPSYIIKICTHHRRILVKKNSFSKRWFKLYKTTYLQFVCFF